MIGANSLVSTFPQVFKSKNDVLRVCSIFVLDTTRHYTVHGNLRTYTMHQMCCVLSTLVGLTRSAYTHQWSPILLRMYSTLVCSCIFYLSLARMHSLKHFRRMPWYLPWLRPNLIPHTFTARHMRKQYHLRRTQRTWMQCAQAHQNIIVFLIGCLFVLWILYLKYTDKKQKECLRHVVPQFVSGDDESHCTIHNYTQWEHTH